MAYPGIIIIIIGIGLIFATLAINIAAITVAGNTGKVLDIKLMYTIIEADTGRVFVPNSIMVTTAVLRKKTPHPILP